ncbi:hypothetical protein F5Y11DRAFT_348031 [Daldinia sp. FL1419]|nr:hypothetical protein F5Y11DRAFT_348031 [Daldinia sp. FL1419]
MAPNEKVVEILGGVAEEISHFIVEALEKIETSNNQTEQEIDTFFMRLINLCIGELYGILRVRGDAIKDALRSAAEAKAQSEPEQDDEPARPFKVPRLGDPESPDVDPQSAGTSSSGVSADRGLSLGHGFGSHAGYGHDGPSQLQAQPPSPPPAGNLPAAVADNTPDSAPADPFIVPDNAEVIIIQDDDDDDGGDADHAGPLSGNDDNLFIDDAGVDPHGLDSDGDYEEVEEDQEGEEAQAAAEAGSQPSSVARTQASDAVFAQSLSRRLNHPRRSFPRVDYDVKGYYRKRGFDDIL